MKNFTKIILAFTLIVPMFISCEKEDKLEPPAEFTVSKGTYIGVIHLACSWVDADEEVKYVAYRFNENRAEWDEIGWGEYTYFDDNGVGIETLVPGKEYKYKIRPHNDELGFGGYTEEKTGYVFKAGKCDVNINVTEQESSDLVTHIISWTDPNDLTQIQNMYEINYIVYRTEDGNLSDFELIHNQKVYLLNQEIEDSYSFSYEDDEVDPTRQYSYKVVADYYYSYDDFYINNHWNQVYTVEGNVSDVEAGSGNTGGGNATIDYTTTDLGEILSASSGNTVFDLKDKVINNNLYVGAVNGSSVIGGKPSLYQFNGSSWQHVWTCDSLDKTVSMHYGVTSTGSSYVLGASDSAYIFKWDGSVWTRISLPNETNGYYGLEVFNDELYVLIKQGDALQVQVYNGSSWSIVGSDLTSLAVSNTNLEAIDGKLYVTYQTYNVDNTLYIRHLDGNMWQTDLQWVEEWLADIELAHSGSDLYYSSGSASTSFDGGVYRVTSSTTVENLIPEEHEDWFTMGAFDLTIDSNGNLIVASMKYEFADASQTELINYPHLNLYDGTKWNTISGDFTDGVTPVTVSAIGTDIYYVYGDASTVSAAKDATRIKAKKMSK